jgi:hypothetical protein
MTPNERARIDSFGLYVVSDLMLAYSAWANSGLRWLDVFDSIDIAAIERQAKANRAAVSRRGRRLASVHRAKRVCSETRRGTTAQDSSAAARGGGSEA